MKTSHPDGKHRWNENHQFNTSPHDVFTIKSSSGVLCDTITIHVSNEVLKEEFWMSWPNRLESWEALKQLAEVGRKVLHQTDDRDPIPYVDSIPYMYRFDRKRLPTKYRR